MKHLFKVVVFLFIAVHLHWVTAQEIDSEIIATLNHADEYSDNEAAEKVIGYVKGSLVNEQHLPIDRLRTIIKLYKNSSFSKRNTEIMIRVNNILRCYLAACVFENWSELKDKKIAKEVSRLLKALDYESVKNRFKKAIGSNSQVDGIVEVMANEISLNQDLERGSLIRKLLKLKTCNTGEDLKKKQLLCEFMESSTYFSIAKFAVALMSDEAIEDDKRAKCKRVAKNVLNRFERALVYDNLDGTLEDERAFDHTISLLKEFINTRGQRLFLLTTKKCEQF